MKNIYSKLNADITNKIISPTPIFGEVIETVHINYVNKIKNPINKNHLNFRLQTEIMFGKRTHSKKKKIYYRFKPVPHLILSEVITFRKEDCQNLLKMFTFLYISKLKRNNWEQFLTKKMQRIPKSFNFSQVSNHPSFFFPLSSFFLLEKMSKNKTLRLKVSLNRKLYNHTVDPQKIGLLILSKIFYLKESFEKWLFIHKKSESKKLFNN